MAALGVRLEVVVLALSMERLKSTYPNKRRSSRGFEVGNDLSRNCHDLAMSGQAHGFQAHILLGLPDRFVYLDEVVPTSHQRGLGTTPGIPNPF